MRKLMLEALAAWLALAMASGPAAAAISATGAQIDPLPETVSPGNEMSVLPFLSNGAAPSISFLLSVPDPVAAPESVTTRAVDEEVHGRSAAVALLTPTATDRSANRSKKPAKSLFGVVDAPRSSVAPSSLSGADDFALGRKNVRGPDLKRRGLHQNVVGHSHGGFVRANVASAQVNAIQTVGLEGSEAAKIDLAAGAKVVPATMVAVPEPGSWATLLAGLLGVIAIGRRRISL
jgi:hypothetical protein